VDVCCECCVMSGKGLCDGPITGKEESYRLWCVWVWSRNHIDPVGVVESWKQYTTMICTLSWWRKNVKQSNYKPGHSLRVPGVWGSQISRQSTHEGGKVVSPTHRPTLPQGNIPGTHSSYRLSRPQGHSAAGRIMSMKKMLCWRTYQFTVFHTS
jgi:hypothetical protein